MQITIELTTITVLPLYVQSATLNQMFVNNNKTHNYNIVTSICSEWHLHNTPLVSVLDGERL